MVPEGDGVRPGGEQRVALLGRHADDVCVFAVDDDKVRADLFFDAPQIFGGEIEAGIADHVADCEYAKEHVGIAPF